MMLMMMTMMIMIMMTMARMMEDDDDNDDDDDDDYYDYCSAVLYGISDRSLHLPELVQDSAARVVLRIRWGDGLA